uniref:Uncharacterized protein n=1 Tax=Arundo donax TaxID=35708 RepID=A0A0A9GGK6_ARUDO
MRGLVARGALLRHAQPHLLRSSTASSFASRRCSSSAVWHALAGTAPVVPALRRRSFRGGPKTRRYWQQEGPVAVAASRQALASPQASREALIYLHARIQ